MILSLSHFALLALGLMATLCLFLALKYEIQVHARRNRRRMDEMARQVSQLQEENQQRPEFAVAPLTPKAGFNVSRRVQAMRMLRRGAEISHVAAALGVPRQEVELLIRVQALSCADRLTAENRRIA